MIGNGVKRFVAALIACLKLDTQSRFGLHPNVFGA